MRNMSLLKLACCSALALGCVTASATRWALVVCPPADPTQALEAAGAPPAVRAFFTQLAASPAYIRRFGGFWASRDYVSREDDTIYTLVRPPHPQFTYTDWPREQQDAAVWSLFEVFLTNERDNPHYTLVVWTPVYHGLTRVIQQRTARRGIEASVIRLNGPLLTWSMESFEDVTHEGATELDWMDFPEQERRPTFDVTRYRNIQTRELARALGRTEGLGGLDYLVRLVGLYLTSGDWDRMFLPIGALAVHTVLSGQPLDGVWNRRARAHVANSRLYEPANTASWNRLRLARARLAARNHPDDPWYLHVNPWAGTRATSSSSSSGSGSSSGLAGRRTFSMAFPHGSQPGCD